MTEAEIRADERTQLAARATDQERGMVERYDAIVEAYWNAEDGDEASAIKPGIESARTTLLAALTASRERGIEECADSVLVGECGDLWCVWLGGGAYVWGFSGLLAKRQAETLAAGIQRSLRALAAPAVAAVTAPQRAEGEG